MRFNLIQKLFGSTPSSTKRPARRPRLRLEALEDRWCPSTLTVGPGEQYATIGAALTAAKSGATIDVYSGTYNEQVTFKTSGIQLIAVPNNGPVIIQDPGLSSAGALINIQAASVKVTGFEINGNVTDPNLLYDVLITGGGSATISSNTILGPIDPSNPIDGIGIQVGISAAVTGTTGTIGTAKINENTISEYYGAGIVVDGTGSSATIGVASNGSPLPNTITGNNELLTSGVPQYGVQVSRGASARVQDNTITANNAAGNSAGIFVYNDGSANTVVAANTLNNNELGVLVQDCTGVCYSVQVVQNSVSGSGYAGIDILSSSNIVVDNNCVTTSIVRAPNYGGNGIALYLSSNVEIENNDTHGNQSDGIFDLQGNGNLIQCNSSYDNGTTTPGNGINIQGSINDNLFINLTWSNSEEGILVTSASGTNIWLGDSSLNNVDGILLSGATNTTVVGNVLDVNGQYGLQVTDCTNVFIALNLVQGNGSGSIYISGSTGVTMIANWTSTAPVVDGTTGAGGTSSAFANSCADADNACSGLADF